MAEPGGVSAAFFFRERSFSLIYFPGAAAETIPVLLMRCGYAIIGEARYEAPFQDVADAIEAIEGPRNTIVHKAAYPISSGSVLIDPEMVVSVSHEDVIAQFCAEHRVEAFVAIWERVSETVFAQHIAAGGILADVVLVAGAIQKPPVNPPASVIREPGPASLKEFLAAAGAPLDEIFGMISARLFKLDESAMFPTPH